MLQILLAWGELTNFNRGVALFDGGLLPPTILSPRLCGITLTAAKSAERINMSASEQASTPPSPLNRLDAVLQKKKQERDEQDRLAREYQAQAIANLQKARETINSVVAPTFVKAQKHLQGLGLPALASHNTQTTTPSATIRWGKPMRTPQGSVPMHGFTIIAVNNGESFKSVVEHAGQPPSDTRISMPLDPVWIEEAITTAVEATLEE